MKKKKLFNLFGILLGIFMCFSFSKVEAADSIFNKMNLTRSSLMSVLEENALTSSSKWLGISATRQSENKYEWNVDTLGNGKKVWKIATYPSETSKVRDYTDLYYCLNATQGFGMNNGEMAEGSVDYYNTSIDMKDLNNQNTIADYANGKLGANYNKILWILDNSYIPTGSSSYKTTDEYKSLIDKAGIEIENEEWDLTEDDIEVVQQMAIWYFTNSDDTDYNHSELPSLYINGEQLSSIYYETTEYGEQITGAERQKKANQLYQYFIQNADADYTPVVPELTLSNEEATVVEDGNYYVSGPFQLTGENAEKIKSITADVNKPYTLLDASKNIVQDNNFSEVIGSDFYLRIDKRDITQDTTITINIEYKYDVKTLIFMTDEDDPENTQPVVLVKTEEKTENINTNIDILLTEVSVEKSWDDNNNQDGVRPTSVQVQLYADGETYGEPITLNASNNWRHTWSGLLAGKAYTVVELDENGNAIPVDEKYNDDYTKVEYSIEGTKTIITNIHIPELIDKTLTKIWDDNGNQDGIRPTSIQVQLYANGKEVGEPITILENNGEWSYTWHNLPKYENGKEIVYTVVEKEIDGYTTTYSDDTFTITNSYTPGKVAKTVIKTWDDDNNVDQIRPDEITVTLYKVVDGQEIPIDTQVLNENNNWRYTWDNLDEKENGETIIYLVKEQDIPGYEATYSAENYLDTNVITITNRHTPEVKGNYNVILKKVDSNGEELSGATIKVNGKEYSVGSATLVEQEQITSEEDIILSYEIEETTAPEDYLGLSTKKNIRIKLEIEKLGTVYNVKRAYIIDENGNQISDNEINVSLDSNTNTILINVVNNPIQKEFDLSLRKFITSVNDNELQREPVVDTSTIATTGTATYKHTKEPVSVQVGDIVTYTIRIYNEGETDGYASEITDYLPEWLDFLPDDELNQKYLWQQDIDNNRKITTNVTSKDSVTGETIYSNRENKQMLSAYNGSDSLDYIDVEIRCRVNENAQLKQLITNIAEISEMQDKEGTEVTTDRDSTIANVNLPTDADLPNYKGNESNKSDLTDKDYYYKGQEDDDDFEKLIVENFDLALRKFIVQVNDQTYSREPVVDTSLLGTADENGNMITTAIYTHSKDPIQVQQGDIITYTIRVYNEGTIAGFANEVVDYIPEGLQFIEDSSINKTYGWTVDGDTIKTTYLSDSNINNSISGVSEDSDGNKVLDYKDLQVQFEVIANPAEWLGEEITNWAEISEDSNNDVDSTPGNNDPDEDDIDYEPVELVYFDLSLRKFITNVDGTDYNNRIPEVDTSKLGTVNEITGEKVTTAEYAHTKDPVILETGSTVVYTIRVYNEGTIDGYASEITDDIPEGLEFLPENEVNLQYKWTMVDEEGNITTDVSQASKITTNYLSEENDSSNRISAYQENNGSVALDYKDVQVAFRVTEPNTSDRIIVNTAQISADSGDDIDSIPGNDILTEDDIDREYVRVETFDLALEKWVTATKVTYNGKTTTTQTGFTADSTEMAKVDLVASQLKKTTVKFVYTIRVINEGQVAGYATEIKDYIPSGLTFVQEDNPEWTLQDDETVTTDQLKDTLLEPGQSATVEITLTWRNSSSNMGVKTNWAEIGADSGDDVDSTPDNYNKIEDDIDDASVILSIKTGSVQTYIILTLVSVMILGGGVFLIKKYVIN